MFSIKETVAKKYWGHCRRVEEVNQTERRKQLKKLDVKESIKIPAYVQKPSC